MLFPAVLLIAVVWGCSTKEHPTLVDGYDGAPGGQVEERAPCSVEGEVKSCGRVVRMDGNYVTCSEGHATCTGGKWARCIGDHYTTQSLPNARLTLGGFSLLAVSGPCGNLCDPSCVSTTADPVDVMAPGIAPADGGGVTLEESDGGLTMPGAGACTGLQCQLVTCGGAATTSISGTVYDPAGNTPLFDANVYIPLMPDDALPAFGSGATCDTCGGAAVLDAIRAAQTDAAGNFTLNDVPAGTNIPIVVQIGKWRREIVLSTVTRCAGNRVEANCTAANPQDCVFRLPRHRKDGYDPVARTYTKADLPKIAIATGSADPFDCLLLKAGIDPTEIGDKSSTARIHYYTSNGNTLHASRGSTVAASTLFNSLATMMKYDVVLLPCEGSAGDKQTGTNTPYQNLISYTNAGGRVFTTHFGYSWLQFPAGKGYVPAPDNWSTVANWAPTGAGMTSSVNTQDPLNGLVNTSFPKGDIYSQWLRNVGASARPSRLVINEGRQDLTSIGPDTQPWMTARDTKYPAYPVYTNLFTFNTPYGAPAANQCGRVVFSDFHVSANALVPTVNSCLTDVDCGYTATCSGATLDSLGQCDETCQTSGDCPNTNFACPGGSAGTCQQTKCAISSECGAGRTCRSGTCTCANDDDCDGGPGSCAGKTCSPTACASSATCGLGTCGSGVCSVVGCHKDLDCGLGTCGGVAKNGSCAAGFACHTDSQCGPTGTCGAGTSSTAGNCSTNATFCHTGATCDSGSCGTGTGSTAGTCTTNSVFCHKASDCDSGVCGLGAGFTGLCAITTGALCHTNSNCDSNSCGAGTGSTAGACSTNSTICHSGASCDSGVCGVGTGFTGLCAIPGGTPCHANANCDSNSCGAGTGATAGTCSTNSTICHSGASCDSGVCGVGTGFTGVCASSTGAICHTNANCDSGSCGVGTGAAAGVCSASACHADADCDAGTCGSGTGSVVGSCSTGAAICHANTDCDSGTCGATGSTGVCTAGACTTNAQCGTSGTCTGGKCVAGSCARDGVCGTANGLCTGAKCAAKPCATDSVCGVSNLCNGAKCATKSCTNDAICTVAGSVCNGAKCSTAAVCAGDAGCPSSNLCNNAKCTVKNCAGDAGCSVGGLCNGAKCSTPAGCAGDAACPASNLCTGSKCTVKTCAGDAGCPLSNLCNNAKCSTPAGCAGDAACPASNLCTGSKCTVKTCAGDAGCSVSNLCNNAKCSTKTCAGDAGCSVGGLCNGAKCSTSSCGLDTQCPLALCTGAKCTTPASCGAASDCGVGGKCTGSVCSQAACTANAECGNGTCGGKCNPFVCSTDADCPGGTCNAGTCSCSIGEDCGGSQACAGVKQGACELACTTDAECAPDRCVDGTCGGCSTSTECHGNADTASCIGIPPTNYGTCSLATPGKFPAACRQGLLSAQEKALEFMLFDLTACVTPDNLPPPVPVPVKSYGPATFTQDFTASCPPRQAPVWREFDWQATIPNLASIVFGAQSGVDAAHLLPPTALVIATATASTDTGPTRQNYDVALMDTGPGGTGPFRTADPGLASGALLRITIKLNPTPNQLGAPSLQQWKVVYDCVDSE